MVPIQSPTIKMKMHSKMCSLVWKKGANSKRKKNFVMENRADSINNRLLPVT